MKRANALESAAWVCRGGSGSENLKAVPLWRQSVLAAEPFAEGGQLGHIDLDHAARFLGCPDDDDQVAGAAAIDHLVVGLFVGDEDAAENARFEEQLERAIDGCFADAKAGGPKVSDELLGLEDPLFAHDHVEDLGPLGGVFLACGFDRSAEDRAEGFDDVGESERGHRAMVCDTVRRRKGPGWGDTMTEPRSMPAQIKVGTPLAFVGVGLALVVAVAAWSSPQGLPAASVVLFKILTAAWPAALYLVAAVGLGRLGTPFFAKSQDPWLVQGGVGVAAMLTISHVLGQIGLVKGTAGLASAWVPIVLGLGLLLNQLTGKVSVQSLEEPPRRWAMLDRLPLMLASAILVVASCNPPGGLGGLSGVDFSGLWRSEFGGFDSLSYHLPVVQEWLAGGRLAPQTHNVYSYLPSYVEAAFLHTAILSGAGDAKGGMLADDGWRLLTCQFLHAGFGILTVIGTHRLVRAWLPGADRSPARLAATFAMATPWAVVVGSLSYNELAVTALSAPLLLVAADARHCPWRRGLLAGLLLGAATSVKPPAFFLLGAPVAALAFTSIPRRSWLAFISLGCVGGLVAMLPWLGRNWAACGNPVFPFAHTIFGLSHWSADQFDRYAEAHRETASIGQRLLMMFVRPENAVQHRGVLHPQWALMFPAAVVAAVFALRAHATHILAARLILGLIGSLALWLTLTHVQSRFLVPLIVPVAALVAIGLSAVPRLSNSFSRAIALLLGLTQAAALTLVFAAQNNGQAGAGLVWMPGDAAGESMRAALSKASSGERLEFFTKQANPMLYVNLGLPPKSTVYLLGDATPLYYTVPVVCNTVWDRWPILEAMDKNPGNADTQGGLWIQSLRARGITHVLVNIPEIGRYRASGYSDPRLTVDAVMSAFVGRAAVVRTWDGPNGPSHVLFSIAATPSGLARAEGRRHDR